MAVKKTKITLYRAYYYSNGTDAYFNFKPKFKDLQEVFDIYPEDSIYSFDIVKVSVYERKKQLTNE